MENFTPETHNVVFLLLFRQFDRPAGWSSSFHGQRLRWEPEGGGTGETLETSCLRLDIENQTFLTEDVAIDASSRFNSPPR